MKVKDSECCKGRYGDIISKLFGEYEVIDDKSENDYSGVEITAKFDDLGLKDYYIYLEFSYGSCAICDNWESRDLNEAQIMKEILDLTVPMNEEEFKEWNKRRENNASFNKTPG